MTTPAQQPGHSSDEQRHLMQIELTERETQLIIEALRTSEKHSRTGFLRWLTGHLSDLETPKGTAKVARANAVFKELATLRERFGDFDPVNINNEGG